MGTLGEYLKNAREARDIDIRDAAQQTRISINYLRALENEDFKKLPGEVFIRGFLKNYARYLELQEAEVLKRYAELKPKPSPPPEPGQHTDGKTCSTRSNPASRQETPIEPFIWGTVLCVSLIVFLFTSLPGTDDKSNLRSAQSSTAIPAPESADADLMQTFKSEKLYLEIVALKDTWLLVRTDTSPQKKAVLKKGESLIWSAEDRFLLSYGHVGDIKLLLNGEELDVRGPGETPVRDLAVTRAGVINQPIVVKQPRRQLPKPKPAVQVQQVRQTPAQSRPSASPAPAAKPAVEPVAPVPAAPPVPPAPATQESAANVAPQSALPATRSDAAPPENSGQ